MDSQPLLPAFTSAGSVKPTYRAQPTGDFNLTPVVRGMSLDAQWAADANARATCTVVGAIVFVAYAIGFGVAFIANATSITRIGYVENFANFQIVNNVSAPTSPAFVVTMNMQWMIEGVLITAAGILVIMAFLYVCCGDYEKMRTGTALADTPTPKESDNVPYSPKVYPEDAGMQAITVAVFTAILLPVLGVYDQIACFMTAIVVVAFFANIYVGDMLASWVTGMDMQANETKKSPNMAAILMDAGMMIMCGCTIVPALLCFSIWAAVLIPYRLSMQTGGTGPSPYQNAMVWVTLLYILARFVWYLIFSAGYMGMSKMKQRAPIMVSWEPGRWIIVWTPKLCFWIYVGVFAFCTGMQYVGTNASLA